MPDSEEPSRVAVVTGAGRGLGRAVARELSARGYQVVTCSTSERGPGVGEALHHRADVTDPVAVDALVEAALGRWGHIDVVVNNAGYANAPSPLQDTSNEIAGRCFATNVLGPYFLLRRVLPGLIARPGGGVVINIASRAGIVPVPGLAAYSASKSALVSLTLALAKEVADERVLCVAICPGGMDTEMRAAVYGPEDARRQLDPLRVAEVVVELATARSLNGRPVPSGSAVLVTKESGATLMEWPRDDRGHQRISLR
jgi:NAD(P)-dependent dehydrogenase (short-subunit alcohol dehydrogenase family)